MRGSGDDGRGRVRVERNPTNLEAGRRSRPQSQLTFSNSPYFRLPSSIQAPHLDLDPHHLGDVSSHYALSRLTILVADKETTTLLSSLFRRWRHWLQGEEFARADDGAVGWRKGMWSCWSLDGKGEKLKSCLFWILCSCKICFGGRRINHTLRGQVFNYHLSNMRRMLLFLFVIVCSSVSP